MRSWLIAMMIVGAAVRVYAQASADETTIRAQRARSNAAIIKKDLAGIAAVWMDDVHVTTSTGARGDGKAANRERMAQQFSRRPDTVYVRTAITVEVFAAWDVASERGTWVGKWTEPDGHVAIHGTYLVQWRKIAGTWLIQSELYVPTSCSGSSYCKQRP